MNNLSLLIIGVLLGVYMTKILTITLGVLLGVYAAQNYNLPDLHNFFQQCYAIGKQYSLLGFTYPRQHRVSG